MFCSVIVYICSCCFKKGRSQNYQVNQAVGVTWAQRFLLALTSPGYSGR